MRTEWNCYTHSVTNHLLSSGLSLIELLKRLFDVCMCICYCSLLASDDEQQAVEAKSGHVQFPIG